MLGVCLSLVLFTKGWVATIKHTSTETILLTFVIRKSQVEFKDTDETRTSLNLLALIDVSLGSQLMYLG